MNSMVFFECYFSIEDWARCNPAKTDILQCIADGLEYDEIAVKLGITRRTVINQMYVARKQFGAKTTAQCIAIALRKGVIE